MSAIIVAAERVLEREGLERTTTTRIAEVAGVSVGSLYQYFPNREAIIGASIDRQLERTLVAFHSIASNLTDLPFEPMVRGVLFGLLEASRTHEKLHALLYDQLSLAHRAHRQRCMLDAYVGVIAMVLQGRTDVAVRDPWAAARLIVHASEGVVRSVVVTTDLASARRLLDEAARMITRYLAPTPSGARSPS